MTQHSYKMQSLRTINIPTQLCQYVIENNLWRPMQVMLCLKGAYYDKVKLSTIDLQSMADTVGCTTKTIRNALHKLIELNWIGYNRRNKYYHVRSFWKIMAMYDFVSLDCAQFDFRNLADSKAHIVAQSIGKLLNYQKKKLHTENRKSAERKVSIRSNQTDLQNNGFFPIANKAIATCWGKSKSHAHRMKRLAANAGMIDVKKERNEELSRWFYNMCRIGRRSEACLIMNFNNERIYADFAQHRLHFKTHRKPFTKHK